MKRRYLPLEKRGRNRRSKLPYSNNIGKKLGEKRLKEEEHRLFYDEIQQCKTPYYRTTI